MKLLILAKANKKKMAVRTKDEAPNGRFKLGQPHQFKVIGDPAHPHIPLRIADGVALIRWIKSGFGRIVQPTLPYVGHPQVRQSHTGDGFIAQLRRGPNGCCFC